MRRQWCVPPLIHSRQCKIKRRAPWRRLICLKRHLTSHTTLPDVNLNVKCHSNDADILFSTPLIHVNAKHNIWRYNVTGLNRKLQMTFSHDVDVLFSSRLILLNITVTVPSTLNRWHADVMVAILLTLTLTSGFRFAAFTSVFRYGALEFRAPVLEPDFDLKE